MANPWDDAWASFEAGKFEIAIRLMVPLADAGNLDAMNWLSHMYWFAEGTERDPEEAFRWSMRAAQLGSARGQSDVAVSYRAGAGVMADDAKSIEWMQKAADQDVPDSAYAQGALGGRYLLGIEVPRDLTLALPYLRSASAKGYDKAQLLLGLTLVAGLYGVESDVEEAARLFRLAADQRNAGGQRLLGLAYLDGIGVTVDRVTGLMWLRLSADRGCISAISDLGARLATATDEEKSSSEALAEAWDNAHPAGNLHRHSGDTSSSACTDGAGAPQPA